MVRRRQLKMNNLSSGTERKAEIPTAKKDQIERRFYRFFSFDTGGRIALAEDHECDSDRSALALGQNILAGKNCPKMEVWFRKERIGLLEKAALSYAHPNHTPPDAAPHHPPPPT